MDKLVSVVVPVYMSEKYLKACVESILVQTYKNLEIILVDDGSKDGCGQMCDDFARRDSRVKVIHKANGGLSSARNAGIDCAKGQYIAFIDSDDTINEEFIEVLYGLCEENDCQVAQCDFLFVKEESVKLGRQKKQKYEVISGREAVSRCCRQPGAVKYNVAWNKLYKKGLFDGIRYPEGKIHEDEFTTYKIFEKAERVAITSLYLHWYLQRTDSIMGGKFNVKRLQRLEAYEERLEFLKDRKMEREYYEFLVGYYQTMCGSYEALKINGVNCQNELKSLEEKIAAMYEQIMNIPGRSYLDNLRTVFWQLPAEEKDKYRKLYGNDAVYARKEGFIFPFHKVPKDSKIAIYGAGDVGKAFFQQVISLRYADVVVWTDALWKTYSARGFDVSPIDELVSSEYDFVVLAIRNQSVAMEVKENLVDWGIEEAKIIWQNPVPIPPMEAVLIQDASKAVKKIEKKTGRRFVLMNTPDHGNLGDHALALAAIKFFNDYFDTEEVIEFTGRQWEYCKDEICEVIQREDILFFVGGGYMGNVWPRESMRVRQIIERFPKNKIVFLPQSFFYERNDYAMDKEFYSKKDNILFIHREKYSYERFMGNVVNNPSVNRLYPDLVLYLNYYTGNTEREGVLFCIRSDKESVTNTQKVKEMKDWLRNESINFEDMDTVVNRNVNMEQRGREVGEMIEKISHAKVLITDRLHGMLFAVISGTPCVVFDNSTNKVKGVFQWIANTPWVKFCDNEESGSAFAKEWLELRGAELERESICVKFEEMANEIKRWISD